MQRCALFCVLLAGTFAASVYAAPAKAAPAPVVCDAGLDSTYEAVKLYNTSYRPFGIAKYLLAEMGPDFKGTVFIPTQRALNATMFEFLLTPFNITGPLPPNILIDDLIGDLLPLLAKYHLVPNVIVDPSKVSPKDFVDGEAFLGPFKTTLKASSIPAFAPFCSGEADFVDPATFGQDVSASIIPDTPVVIGAAGSSGSVNATTVTCGGIIHMLDTLALVPCLPEDITAKKHAALVDAIMAKIKDMNATYIKSLKSAAPTTVANAMLTVAISCIAMLALAFGL